MNEERLNILVTGAGGAAAIAFHKALAHDNAHTLHMCDMDPLAQGLYLVPAIRRHRVPAGSAPDFAERLLQLCHRLGIDVLVPTVDCELPKVAAAKAQFAEAGIQVIVADTAAIETCCDKLQLLSHFEQDNAWIGWVARFDQQFLAEPNPFPYIVKPRVGSGGRGVKIVRCDDDVNGLPLDGSYLAQEYLPGPEYSVDTYSNCEHRAIACVVRERLKVDSGVAVVSRTVRAPAMVAAAKSIAQSLKLRYVANIQFKLDGNGQAKLLEINPRFPGTMPLTVAAGVNMPALCLREARDLPLAAHYEYRQISVVRTWHETFLPVDALRLPESPSDAALSCEWAA